MSYNVMTLFKKRDFMKKDCIKVSIITLIGNVLLSIFKLISGIIGRSSAMISDAIHSMSDVFSTVIVIIGINLSNKKIDKKHQYGHERFESVASIILAFMLFMTGIIIGGNGIKNIYNNHFVIPSTLPLIAAIISIITKEWMYHYTIKFSKKYNSDSLKADAWHHRSDAFSSVGSLIGIFAAIKGLKYMDLVASIIISIIIIKTSIDIFIDSINKVLDTSCDEKFVCEIKELILDTKEVNDIDLLKTRVFGNKVYVDLEISLDKDLTFSEAHNISHIVHDKIENKFSNIKHCMIHINPK